ncbi:ABC transporter substrate-binding protein [Streptomyces sp. NPDC005955]|uniref:ABC transporter substrate-binding protein n=1 Tax=Streptomyces sp. NPDC005955 TaxID=3364738 RepID=UPI00367C47D2
MPSPQPPVPVPARTALTWDVTFPAPTAPDQPSRAAAEGVSPALLRRVAGFHQAQLTDARFLWCEDGEWALCHLELSTAPQEEPVVTLRTAPLTGPPSGLTAREVDIISLVALGLSNRETSSRLGTSIRTVTTQVERLLKKLGQDSRAGLSALAVDRDLIRLPIPGGVEHRSGIRVLDIERHAATVVGLPVARRSRRHHPATGRAGRPTVRIGTIVVAGAFAADGRESARGAALAVRDINALRHDHGRSVEHLTVHIDPFDPASVEDALAELAEADVDAVTSSYASALSPAVFGFAADFGRTFLHTNTWTRSVDAVRADPRRLGHVFQTCPSETAYQSALLGYLRGHRAEGDAPPRVAIVELDGYGCAITDDTFTARVREAGWSVTSTHRVGLTVEHVDDLVKEVLHDRPDLVVVSHLSVETAAALQNAITRHRPHQLTYHIYTPSVPGFARRIEHRGGQVIWSTVTGRPDDPLGLRFSERYARAFGVPPGRSQASAAYDQVRMVHAAFSITGSLRPEAVGAYLRDSAYRGVNGTYLFASPGQAVSGYPYDSGDASLSQPIRTYRLSTAGQELLPLPA